MTVEKRFANLFPTGQEAHAFESHVRGAALEAGLSVGPGGVEDLGLPGSVVRLTLTGAAEALDRFAGEPHEGTTLSPA